MIDRENGSFTAVMKVRGILKDVTKLKGIGVYKFGDQVRLLFLPRKKELSLYSVTSLDGLNYADAQIVKLLDVRERNINLERLTALRVSCWQKNIVATYKIKKGLISSVLTARSINLSSFKTAGRIPQISETAEIVPDYRFEGNFVAFSGGRNIRLLTSKDLVKWRLDKKPALTAGAGNATLEVGTVEKTGAGILVLYFEKLAGGDGKPNYAIRAVIFDENNPRKQVFKTKEPIWEQPAEWNSLDVSVEPFGLVTFGERLISYWNLNGNELLAIIHEKKQAAYREGKETPSIILKKFAENPILKPIVSHFWESKATFNPAAVYDEGKVHIVYRAIGDHDMSMLGYASSRDGINIDERLDEPIYVPSQPFEYAQDPNGPAIPISRYASGGGGYGGCEDPRITKVGKRFYMTYVAFNGSGPPRVALTSIRVSDFHKKQWNWTDPVLISKPGEVDKNAVVFPEQINGKYVIMHRIYPDILIDFVDDLAFDGKTFLKGEYKISPRRNSWDSRKIGAGAPPIKTSEGWLLIYHAVDDRDAGRYKMGAMLLDLDDPRIVLARTRSPILEPVEAYENEGYKAGVAYPCGSVIIGDKLHVYYGGADTVTCVATAKLSKFLTDLKEHSCGRIHPVAFAQ